MTPTQRSLALLRKEGYTPETVERYNCFTHTRKDLFGCIDIIAAGPDILAVQATSGSHVAHRLTKAKAQPQLKAWLSAGGRFEVWGWRLVGKKGKRKTYQVRRVAVTLEDLPANGQ